MNTILLDIAMKIAIAIRYSPNCKALGITVDNAPLLSPDGTYKISVYWNPSMVIGKDETDMQCKTTLKLDYNDADGFKVDFHNKPITEGKMPTHDNMNVTILKYLADVMNPILVRANEKHNA